MLYKQHKLKNGLNLVFVQNKKIKLIYIHIGIKIGSDTETVKTLELSHFIEHLFTLLTSNKYNSGLENRNMLSKYNIEQDAEVITTPILPADFCTLIPNLNVSFMLNPAPAL